MSDLEKYILGLLPKEDLGPIYSFIGDPIVFDKYCTKTKGEEDVFSNCFNASEKIIYIRCQTLKIFLEKFNM